MPNWCYTEYRITGPKKKVKALYNKMNQLENRKETLVPNGFGKTWLGNLVTSLKADWNTISCRGEWDMVDYDESDNVLSFSTSTAWGPCYETFDLVEEKYPGIKIYYSSEEDGMGFYETNDREGRFFTGRYIYDDCQGDPAYFDTEEELIRYFQSLVEDRAVIKSLDDIERFLEEHSDEEEFEYSQCKIYNVV